MTRFERIPQKIQLAITRAATLFACALMTFSLSARASVLWNQSGPILAHDNGAGEDILHGAIQPQGTNSSKTLYVKFQVAPLSDAAFEGTGVSTFYAAGLYFYERGAEHLGLGNAWEAIAYSAINMTGGKKGELDFYSAHRELGREFECVRKGTPVIILAKIEYIPGRDALVTVWLNPTLSLEATELNQPTNIVTHFEANATFDEIRLLHKGTGDGWKFSDLAVATTFEDFVQPRFWQRKSFMGLMMGGMLLAVAVTVRLTERRRAQRQIREFEKERAVAGERARIARDIHDELGASLTKISRLAETMEQQNEMQKNTGILSKSISSAARDTIQTMDEIVWALNPKNDTLKGIANYLVFFTEDFLRPSGIACCLDVPLKLPHIPVTAEVRHNLFMVVKEALNNAVKHAKAQEIRFSLNYANSKLTVEIADNGRGFCIEQNTAVGNGLENMQKRMNGIGGKFHLICKLAQGTIVRLEVVFQEAKVGYNEPIR